jgi:hypothetical protein
LVNNAEIAFRRFDAVRTVLYRLSAVAYAFIAAIELRGFPSVVIGPEVSHLDFAPVRSFEFVHKAAYKVIFMAGCSMFIEGLQEFYKK